METQSVENIRLQDGTLPTTQYTFLLVYVSRIGEIFCPDCANDTEESILDDPDPDYSGSMDKYTTYMHGPPVTCDGCDARIESYYDDPDYVRI